MHPVTADVFNGNPSTPGQESEARSSHGRAELDRELAAQEAPFSGGRFVVKIVATIR